MEKYVEESHKNAFPQIKPIELRCAGNNIAVHLCTSKKCQKSAYLCGSDQCRCHQQMHELCSYFKIDSLLKKLAQKQLRNSKKVSQFIKGGQQIYDQILQMVSQQRQRFLNTFQCLERSMDIDSTKFLNILEGKSKDNLNGALAAKIMKKLKDKQCMGYLEYDWKKVELLWTAERETMQKKIHSITEQLLKLVNKITVRSKIVRTIDEQTTLLSFFPQKVKSIRNIYRASQQNFSTEQFIKKCCGIKNTITLALTEAGKKIGGFTPLAWKKTGEHEVDFNRQTFLFSLTHKQKYENYTRQNTVYHSLLASGPSFGVFDFKIVQRADNKTCSFSLGKHYKIQNSIQSKEHISARFSGATDESKITLKQWQVFEVIFQ